MMPARYRPMLATLIDAPFDGKAYIFETKWDGFRLIADVKGAKVALYSRNGTNVTNKYPTVAKALSKLKIHAVLDGELVALDKKGISRFQLLQNAMRAKTNLRYCVFDILFLNGKDVRKLPLVERKEKLSALIPKNGILFYSAHRSTHGKKYFKEAKRKREEGIMAKRANGFYYSGKRTREWLKIKTSNEQEVVIVGYTKPRRSRTYFGSLALAVREGKRWSYVGHVGTGFDAAMLKSLYQKMKPLANGTKPFPNNVPFEKETTWITPKLVCEVKFTEWTTGGEMRHPAFLGLRDDKPANKVIREKA